MLWGFQATGTAQVNQGGGVNNNGIFPTSIVLILKHRALKNKKKIPGSFFSQ